MLPAEKQSGNFEEDVRRASDQLAIAVGDLVRMPLNETQKHHVSEINAIMGPVVRLYRTYREQADEDVPLFTLHSDQVEAITRAMPTLLAVSKSYAAMTHDGTSHIGRGPTLIGPPAEAAARVSGLVTLCDIFAAPTHRPAMTKRPALQLVQP